MIQITIQMYTLLGQARAAAVVLLGPPTWNHTL
jgi:hypothetical protein